MALVNKINTIAE